jgi:hypothetical protein
MNAIASLFTAPAIRHVASRIVVAGVTVHRPIDIPPMPFWEDRQDAKKKYRAEQMRRYRDENQQAVRDKEREWKRLNADHVREVKRAHYLKVRGSEKVKQQRAAAQMRYIERKKHEN